MIKDAGLRQHLQAILDLEAADPVDWAQVQKLSSDTLPRISQRSGNGPPPFVYHYLADADLRQKDAEYAEMQRKELCDLLDD